MMTWIRSVLKSYHDMVANDPYADPRTKDLFLISSPFTLMIIMISYVYFCTRCGPKWMEKRQPFELRRVAIIHNVLQVLFSCYAAYKGTVIYSTYSWLCQPRDLSSSPEQMDMINISWWYFIAKITELLDTVLFVLRKKNNQITFLHIFHHTLMPLGTWFGIRYIIGGHGVLFGVLNSYVHIVMYTYYFIASLGPKYQKYLWWKRHVTEMQLIQFIIIFFHHLHPLFWSCEYPALISMMEVVFSSVFIYLFGRFYLNTYIFPENKNKKET